MHKRTTHSSVKVSIDRITAHNLSSIAHTGALLCAVGELIARVARCRQIQFHFTRHRLELTMTRIVRRNINNNQLTDFTKLCSRENRADISSEPFSN